MKHVLDVDNYQLCNLALFHHGYLAVTPHTGHYGFQLTETIAQQLVDAVREVFPEVK